MEGFSPKPGTMNASGLFAPRLSIKACNCPTTRLNQMGCRHGMWKEFDLAGTCWATFKVLECKMFKSSKFLALTILSGLFTEQTRSNAAHFLSFNWDGLRSINSASSIWCEGKRQISSNLARSLYSLCLEEILFVSKVVKGPFVPHSCRSSSLCMSPFWGCHAPLKTRDTSHSVWGTNQYNAGVAGRSPEDPCMQHHPTRYCHAGRCWLAALLLVSSSLYYSYNTL